MRKEEAIKRMKAIGFHETNPSVCEFIFPAQFSELREGDVIDLRDVDFLVKDDDHRQIHAIVAELKNRDAVVRLSPTDFFRTTRIIGGEVVHCVCECSEAIVTLGDILKRNFIKCKSIEYHQCALPNGAARKNVPFYHWIIY